ncbi:MAG: hypothetical protein KDA75_06985 [Planctomycetaceae bacterium]|nr:hypothetical protein [Planctomycetaceae bacterium]
MTVAFTRRSIDWQPTMAMWGAAGAALLSLLLTGSCRGQQSSRRMHLPLFNRSACRPVEQSLERKERRILVRQTEPALNVAETPIRMLLVIECDPTASAAHLGLAAALGEELAAAFAGTQQFAVIETSLQPAPGAFGRPFGEAAFLVASAHPGIEPGVAVAEVQCLVRISAAAPAPPLWMSAEIELRPLVEKQPVVRMQGTWRPPELLRPVHETRRSRWRPSAEPTEPFEPDIALIATSPRSFARYVANDAAESISRQWRGASGQTP